MIWTASDGFLESADGSSTIVKGFLSEASVLKSQEADSMQANALRRLLGGGFWDGLSKIADRASELVKIGAPLVKAGMDAHKIYKELKKEKGGAAPQAHLSIAGRLKA